jgi:hypothetical protein
MKCVIRKAAIMLLVGMFVFTQEAYSDKIIIVEEELEFEKLSVGSPDFSTSLAHYSAGDTLETFDIEVEEEGGLNYKEIAAIVVLAAFITYMVIVLITPDEEEEVPDNGGKPTPGAAVHVPIPLSP